MPDIATSDKHRIRTRAKHFVLDLWGGQFKNSFMVYDITLRALYKHAARWNFCLLCGEINTVKELKADHDCIKNYTDKLNEDQLSNPKNIPMIISTSWIKLKEFFLTDKHMSTLKKLGVEIKYEADMPIITASKAVPIVKEEILTKEEAKLESDSG